MKDQSSLCYFMGNLLLIYNIQKEQECHLLHVVNAKKILWSSYNLVKGIIECWLKILPNNIKL